jgi:NAD(P)-dependent dehydrogenase (short-subunit alcohol dehydrogenase family)
MDLGLEGRVVLVTGGSRGIGHAITRELVAEGARVAICGRDGEACDAAALQIGGDVAGFTGDVTDDGSIERLVAGVVERFGGLDAVVNNAGQFGGGPALELADAAVLGGADAKTAGALRVVRHAMPQLRSSDQARVVNVSGISAQKVTPGALVTALANSSMLALTAYLSHELAADGVTVNAVIPGYTLSGVWADRAATVAETEGIGLEAALQLILDRQAMGHARWGRTEEVAAAVVFLLSEKASFVNGISLRVDGGQFTAVTY